MSSLLPDINPDGTLKDFDTVPRRYTPPGEGRRSTPVHPDEFHNDRMGTHLKDAPTMNNIHECVPGINYECIICRREMLV